MKKFIWLLVFSFVPTAFSQESVTVPLLEEYLVAQGLPVQVGMDTVTKDDVKEIQRAGMLGKFPNSKDGWAVIGGSGLIGLVPGALNGIMNGEVKVSRTFTANYGTRLTEKLRVESDGRIRFRMRKYWPVSETPVDRYIEFVVPDSRELVRISNTVAQSLYPEAADVRLNLDIILGTPHPLSVSDYVETIHPEARQIVVQETLREMGVPIAPGDWQNSSRYSREDPFHQAEEALAKVSNRDVSSENILDEFQRTLSNNPEIKPMDVEDVVQWVPDENLDVLAKYKLDGGRIRGGLSGGFIGMMAGAAAGGIFYSLTEKYRSGNKQLSIDQTLKSISPYLRQWNSVRNGHDLMAAHESAPIPLSLALFTGEVREFIQRKKPKGSVPITIYRVENRT